MVLVNNNNITMELTNYKHTEVWFQNRNLVLKQFFIFIFWYTVVLPSPPLQVLYPLPKRVWVFSHTEQCSDAAGSPALSSVRTLSIPRLHQVPRGNGSPTRPPSTSDAHRRSRLSLVLPNEWLHIRGGHDPLLGLIDLLSGSQNLGNSFAC